MICFILLLNCRKGKGKVMYMGKYLEKVFRLSQYDTNIKTELIAGITTFVTMAYSIYSIFDSTVHTGFLLYICTVILIHSK